MAKGNISVDSENLFPIIKKWLYSDKDIFLRELVSNGCDAVTKLKKLASIGEAQIDENERRTTKVLKLSVISDLVFTVRLWLPTVLKLIRFHIKTVQKPQNGLVTEVWNLT